MKRRIFHLLHYFYILCISDFLNASEIYWFVTAEFLLFHKPFCSLLWFNYCKTEAHISILVCMFLWVIHSVVLPRNIQNFMMCSNKLFFLYFRKHLSSNIFNNSVLCINFGKTHSLVLRWLLPVSVFLIGYAYIFRLMSPGFIQTAWQIHVVVTKEVTASVSVQVYQHTPISAANMELL